MIRTRENKIMGKKRVDKLHEFFLALMPKHSQAYEKFYEKAWDPECSAAGTAHDHDEKKYFVN